MGLRTGLVIGMGIGYVLGTKAGRERYELIRRTAKRLADSPTGRRVTQSSREFVDSSLHSFSHRMADASQKIRKVRPNGHF